MTTGILRSRYWSGKATEIATARSGVIRRAERRVICLAEITMNRFKHLAACVACIAVAASGPAYSQTYPARPIRSIMTVAGGADIIARLVAQGLTASLGQPVVVETLSGAGGAIGAEAGAAPAPAGDTPSPPPGSAR